MAANSTRLSRMAAPSSLLSRIIYICCAGRNWRMSCKKARSSTPQKGILWIALPCRMATRTIPKPNLLFRSARSYRLRWARLLRSPLRWAASACPCFPMRRMRTKGQVLALRPKSQSPRPTSPLAKGIESMENHALSNAIDTLKGIFQLETIGSFSRNTIVSKLF